LWHERTAAATYHFARAAVYAMMNIYVVKIARVFMIIPSLFAIAPLAGCPRVYPHCPAAVRQLLRQLELCGLPGVRISAKHQYSGRQLAAIAGSAP
jgi:hypothetical protein